MFYFYYMHRNKAFLQDLMVGEECTEMRQMLDVNYPMENGIVRNWEDMGHIWDHTFGSEKLDIDPTVSVVKYILVIFFFFRNASCCWQNHLWIRIAIERSYLKWCSNSTDFIHFTLRFRYIILERGILKIVGTYMNDICSPEERFLA